jgi:all-trans-retinol 13,14-reductase
MPDVYDRVRIGGQQFDYVTGKERLRAALVGAFPSERAAIDRYFELVARCLRWMPPYYIEKTLPVPLASALGRPMRAPFLRYARRTTGEVLAGLGVSPELKAVLTAQWGDYGLPPGQSSFAAHAIVTAHYFEGASYPIGGSTAIVRGLMPTIERAGGAVVVAAEVARILVSDGAATGVRLADGREFRAANVVSDAGARLTMERLLPEASATVDRRRDEVGAVGRSVAHAGLYVGVDARRLRRPLAGTNLWVHPSVDFDANWSRFAADPAAPLPLLFISFPSAKDPTFQQRHPGRGTIDVVVPVPYDLVARWSGTAWHRRGAEYDAFKTTLQQRLLEGLLRHVPEAAGAVEYCELSTPLSTRHFVNAARGEMYGLTHAPERFACRGLRPATPVRHLFLTGQDISTCGVAGALAGAMSTASLLLRRNMFAVAADARPAAA